MNLFDRVLSEPEFRDDPPVLVDVGAAGGVHPAWRRIARHAIGIGFDGDTRETAALSRAHRLFRRWIFVPGVAAATVPPGGTLPLHLTRSPQCSSLLPPDKAGLAQWAFADSFSVVEARAVGAQTLVAALSAHNLHRVDWLKCDTQGTDLRLFLSLPESWRRRALMVEMEPGLIDAYEGEDKLSDVLTRMRDEAFWVAGFNLQWTGRGGRALLETHLGSRRFDWYRRLVRCAPGWTNITYLRDFTRHSEMLDRRAHLLGWILASCAKQPAAALAIAEAGLRFPGGGIFQEMMESSMAAIRRSIWCAVLPAIVRRLRRR